LSFVGSLVLRHLSFDHNTVNKYGFFNAVFEKFTSIYLKQITSKYKLKPFKLVWMGMLNFSIFGKGCQLFTLVVAHSERLIGTF
jgi:hypothetical protein